MGLGPPSNFKLRLFECLQFESLEIVGVYFNFNLLKARTLKVWKLLGFTTVSKFRLLKVSGLKVRGCWILPHLQRSNF